MCLPEVIFFDDKSGDRHSRRRGNALRPFSADPDDPPPILSSPPFVVQVSPKVGHHHRPSTRYQRAEPRSALPASRMREEIEWREGFRAGRQAKRTSEGEEKKGVVAEAKRTVRVEDQAKATVPEITVTAPKLQRTTTTISTSAEAPPTRDTPAVDVPSKPVPAHAEPAPEPPPVRQAPICATIPAFAPPPATTAFPYNPAPRSKPQRAYNTNSSPYHQEHQSYTPTRHLPRHSSLSLRALRRRLSALWTHITAIERRVVTIDTAAGRPEVERERARWQTRRQSEAETRRAREWEAAEEARRRRRMGRPVVAFAENGRLADRRDNWAGGSGARMVRRVVVVDERRR